MNKINFPEYRLRIDDELCPSISTTGNNALWSSNVDYKAKLYFNRSNPQRIDNNILMVAMSDYHYKELLKYG